jgi:integrase
MPIKWSEESVLRLSAPADRDVWMPDPIVAGHGIRFRGGIGSYGLRFGLDSRDRRLRFARVGAVTLASSRAWARERLEEIARGEDPATAQAKREERQKTTLGNLARRYLDHLDDIGRRYVGEVRQTLTVRFEALRDIPVSDIDKAMIVRVLNDVRDKTSAATMRNARAHASAFFNWCIEQDEMTANPVNGTTRIKLDPRTRVLSDDELLRIWNSLDGMSRDYADIVRLLCLLGLRREGVAGLRFSEIDFQGMRIRLPAERTKTGRAFDCPLPPKALAILQARQRVAGRDLVFGTGSNGFDGFSKLKKKLDAASGVDGWHLHDARHTIATVLSDRYRVAPHIADAILEHTLGGMTSRYNHSTFFEERRDAMLLWEQHIDRLINSSAK